MLNVKVHSKFEEIVKKTEPFLLSYPGNWPAFNFSPFGVEIPKENRFSCIKQGHAMFFDLLHALDGLAFGPMGMPMDKWVFFDCGEMPGGIFGLGVRASALNDSALAEYKIDKNYKGLIPVSMYVSIPMVVKDVWFGHNLSSANRVLKDKMPGLGLLTKALALKAFNIKTMLGATQWDSKALEIHLQLADMEIESSYTPAHSFKNTMTYKSIYSDEIIISALSGNKRDATKYDFLYPSEDENFSIKVQDRIESGERFKIVGRPINENGKIVYPIKAII